MATVLLGTLLYHYDLATPLLGFAFEINDQIKYHDNLEYNIGSYNDIKKLSTNYNSFLLSTISSSKEIDQNNSETPAGTFTDLDDKNLIIKEFPVPEGSRPHDVAPATSMLFPELSNNSKNLLKNIIWYTAQASGELGKLNSITGETTHINLGEGSRPHGVISGPDGSVWITDGGLNAIVKVDPFTENVTVFTLPSEVGYANLNTATFDKNGTLWFTGQSGIYGRLYPSIGSMEIFDSPKGAGPYGITTTPDGAIYYASLAGSYVGRIDIQTGEVELLEPPTLDQGARRVWSDSFGNIWISEWNSGKIGMYDPQLKSWKEWNIPGQNPKPYAIYVDSKDKVWISDFDSNSMFRFNPIDESFDKIEIPSQEANIRQILGIEGEIWGAESGTDKLLLIETG